MSLYKRGRVWWSYVYVDGVRHAKSTGTGNLRIAQKIDQQFKEELTLARLGMRVPVPEMTFGELAARFIAQASPKPYHLDRLKILLPYFGEVPIGRIHKGLAREFRADRHAHKQVSDTTVNRDLEALRHLLYWAMDEGLLVANPLSRMPLVRERRIPRRVMSVAEEGRLLQAAAPHLRTIIIAALDAGMRRGELLGQRWEHVDLGRGLLCVTRSKTAGGEGREIPLTQRLQAVLAARAQSQGLIFTFKDQPIRIVKTAWKAAIRRAGISYYRFHDLRHAFNTRLMEAGVMQEVRKALMGHSSGEDTNSIYTHIELPVKREAIRKLEAWVAQQKQQFDQQGGRDDSTEVSGTSSAEGRDNGSGRTETVEEKKPGGCRA
ncbi:MAG: site-specific integrase [Methanomassiliicoccales archaeon]|nr:site-specific integrase [Methanomassiliicoccales archaeon]